MHTMQLLLTQCKKKQDLSDMSYLVDEVEINLDACGNDHWWDWWQIGGRWEGHLNKQIAPMIWPNQLESPVALRLTKENKQMALKLLKSAKEQQDKYLLENIKNLKDTGVDLNEYILSPDRNIEGWQIPSSINSIFALRDGRWTYESGFVDCTRWGSARVDVLIDYLEEKEGAINYWNSDIENYALVVVDFHF